MLVDSIAEETKRLLDEVEINLKKVIEQEGPNERVFWQTFDEMELT